MVFILHRFSFLSSTSTVNITAINVSHCYCLPCTFVLYIVHREYHIDKPKRTYSEKNDTCGIQLMNTMPASAETNKFLRLLCGCVCVPMCTTDYILQFNFHRSTIQKIGRHDLRTDDKMRCSQYTVQCTCNVMYGILWEQIQTHTYIM